MTLFLYTTKRTLEISDVYVMALSFVIFYMVGRILKGVIKKQNEKIKLVNPRGGELDFSDNRELIQTILVCINDNERYFVKNPQIKRLIFHLVKFKLTNESL